MRHCIAACTLSGCNYPGFVSVNHEEDGQVEFTVRGEAVKTADGFLCGETVSVKIPAAEFEKMARELYSFRCTGKA